MSPLYRGKKKKQHKQKKTKMLCFFFVGCFGCLWLGFFLFLWLGCGLGLLVLLFVCVVLGVVLWYLGVCGQRLD